MADRTLQVKIGANITGLKKGVNEAKGVLTDLSKSVNNMTAAFASIASLGVLAAPLAAAKQWANAVNDLEDKTNMAAESASRLLAIGQRVGLSADEMGNAVMRMSKAAQTSNEHFGESSDVFSKWGIAIRDSNGNLLDAETILGNVATKHAQMANGVQKNAMEMEIFGRAGGKLNDLLNFSKEELAAFGKQAEKVGLVLSHDVTQAFENAQFKINDAKNALQGIGVTIGAEMLPEFEALADFCSDLATSFATSTKEQKRFITIGLEGAGVAGSMAIAIQAVAAAYGFMVGAAAKATAAIKALSAAMAANPVGLAAMGLTAVGYAAYNGYSKSTAKNSKGENLYKPEYDDLGNVSWVRTDAAEDTATATAPVTTAPAGTQVGVVGNYEAFAKNEEAKTAKVKEERQKREEVESEYDTLRKSAQTAIREADWEEFSQYLESEQAAKLQALEEEREIREQFSKWKMEAAESEMAFGIQAAEQLKQSLASGLADCIVNGENLADTLKNIGKQIVQMFLQWMINKRLAAVLDMTLGQQTAKANAAAAIGQASALSAAAIQQSIAQLGPIAGPPAYAAAVGTMTGMASGSIAAAGAISLFAKGGIVTGPTLAMIGEGRDNEAVIPLNANSFQAIADGISQAGGGMTNTLIINGDVNNAGDLDSIMADFGDAVFAGLRGA